MFESVLTPEAKAKETQKSPAFFQDAELHPEPQLKVAFSWEECKSFFIDQVRQLAG